MSNLAMSSALAAIDNNDGRDEGQPGTVGTVGPLFSQQSSSPLAKHVKSAGAKPSRPFVWLGQVRDVSSIDFSSVEGKKIKFERKMTSGDVLTLLKREIQDIGTAR